MPTFLRQTQNKGAANILVIVVVIAAIAIGGYLVFQNKARTEPSHQANYLNENFKFALQIPQGFLVEGDATLLHVVRKPTEDNETPSPEISIKIEKGSKTTIDATREMTIVSQDSISINGVDGHKTTVSYESYPKGNECPIYRLHKNGTVYEFSLYECSESDIFEEVVESFKII